MNRGPGDRATIEHRYVEERLSAYLDGRLSSQEQRVVEHHLARCPACRWNLRTLRQTVQWTRELPTVPVPRAFTLPVAPRARAVPRPRRSWLPVLQGATALVALLLVVVVAGDLLLLGLLPASAPRPVAMPEQPAAAVQVTQEAALSKEAGPPPSEKVEKAVVVASPTPSLLAQPEMAPEVPPQETAQAEAAVVGSPLPFTTTTQESMAELMVAEPLSLTITSTVEPLGVGGAISEPQPIEGSAMALAAPVTEPVILPTLDMAMARSWTTETVPLPPSLPATPPEMVPSFTAPAPDVHAPVAGAEAREGTVISPSIGISPMATVEVPAVSPSPTVEAEALAVVPSPTMEMKALPSARAPLAPQPTAEPTQVKERPSTPTAVAAAPQPVLPTPVGQVVQEAAPAREDSERAALALDRTPLVGWLRAAEIGLGTLFVVLAMVTLVLMIGRRQAR